MADDELLRAVAATGADAWPALAAELEPYLTGFAKRQPIGRLRDHATRPDRWISLATLSSAARGPNPDSLRDKRTQLVAFVREMVERAATAIARLALEWKVERIHTRRLIARERRYLDVLVAVLDGHSYPEIATQLGISRREVELSVRYLEQLLEARGFAR